MTTMTARQKKERAKAEYDEFLAACAAQDLFARISDKWVALVLSALGSGPGCTGVPRPLRYSELARAIAGVSPKMLAQTLRNLERDGFLRRTVTPTVPVTVTYELTELGLSLHEALRRLKGWAQEHMGEVNASRAEYDRRA